MRGDGPAAEFEEISRHRAEYDIFNLGTKLRSRSLLIISGSRDDGMPLAETHEPMVAALKAAGAPRVESVVYDDDHPFSAHRIALARKVTTWLQTAMPARQLQ